jgi:hypothetical protein
MGGSFDCMILGVESEILYQSEQLCYVMITVSLLEVLASSPRKVFRYDIN